MNIDRQNQNLAGGGCLVCISGRADMQWRDKPAFSSLLIDNVPHTLLDGCEG